MRRLTLRTLLAYLDDTLTPEEARALGRKVAESEEARQLIERIKRVTRRRGLTAPVPGGDDANVSDANTVAEYLSDALKTDQLRELEETCLTSDVHLAEVAACHQILTLVLTEPVRVPPSANQRMYLLVDPPASDLNRRPSKTLPIGGLVPPPDTPDADDTDAALLLGMKRYAASESWAGRVGLMVAVGVVAASLVIAVLMALPRDGVGRPETFTAALPPPAGPGPDAKTTPGPNGGKPAVAEPKPEKKGDGDSGIKKQDGDTKKDKNGMPVAPMPKESKVQPPLRGDDAVGRLETKDAIVLTRRPEAAGWIRIDPALGEVRASQPILALPGFKAEVKLKSDLLVHLWGNVPEQLAMPQLVLQSRVVFHPPPPGFDADITVVSGRIYLRTAKTTGAKVRLRLESEVWDVELPKNTAEVLAQVHTAFTPGAKLGDKPRTQATVAVVAEAVGVQAPGRFKSFDNVAAGKQIAWDSVTGLLSEPTPILVELFPPRDPGLDPKLQKVLDSVLADALRGLTSPEGIRIMLKERLTRSLPDNLKMPPTPLQALSIAFPTQFAIYASAAIMEGAEAAEIMKDLIDTLGDAARPYARQATVMALSAWVAQEMGNSELLVKGMIAKGWRDDDSELIVRLLRGYASFDQRDPTSVDDLVGYLNHPQLAVREVALGNLFAFFDPEAIQAADLVIDVSRRGEPAYDRFLASWKTRAAEIKSRMEKK